MVTPSHGVIFCRAVQPGDRLEQEQCFCCKHLEIQTISPQSNIQWLSNICFRHKSEQDHSDVCHGMKRAKEMLDKDSVFFWRLFQDIFKTSNINFTGNRQSLIFSLTDPVLRIAGDAKCQQFSKWKGHLQKGFRLCPLQVGTRILEINTCKLASSSSPSCTIQLKY